MSSRTQRLYVHRQAPWIKEPLVFTGDQRDTTDQHTGDWCFKSIRYFKFIKAWWCRYYDYHPHFWASLVAQMVKNLPVMQETLVRTLGWEDPLEKGMATHSSILAWRIPWTEVPDRLVHGVAKNRTRLSDWLFHTSFISILQIRKLRHRAMRWLVQGHLSVRRGARFKPTLSGTHVHVPNALCFCLLLILGSQTTPRAVSGTFAGS